MKSTNPLRARVTVEISIHDAVAAIEHFAENLPNDRQSRFIANRVLSAGATMGTKADAEMSRLMQEAATKRAQSSTVTVIPGVNYFFDDTLAKTSRFDCSKENHGNTPKEANQSAAEFDSERALDKLRRMAERATPESDATGYVDPPQGCL